MNKCRTCEDVREYMDAYQELIEFYNDADAYNNDQIYNRGKRFEELISNLRNYSVSSYYNYDGYEQMLFLHNGGQRLDTEECHMCDANVLDEYAYCPKCGKKL